jgi:nucleotide-binding universal stress UspA family protein
MLRFRTVLCPVDFSELCEREVDLAIQICHRFGARLVFHHNLDLRPPNYMAVTWMYAGEHTGEPEQRERSAEECMQELFKKVPKGMAVEGKVSRGAMDVAVLRVAHEVGADLIVMGTHGASNAEHSSLTESLIVQAPCPVLTVREGGCDTPLFSGEQPPAGERWEVLVPVDFAPYSLAAADLAFALAEQLPIHLTLVHVEAPKAARAKDTGEAEAEAQRLLEEARYRIGKLVPDPLADRTDVHVDLGKPVDQILAEAHSNDSRMVVMGAHAKGFFKKMLGGAPSREMLHHSACPVLFVPQKAMARVQDLQESRQAAAG